MKIDHILIIRFSAIGDIAMTVPVVYSLGMEWSLRSLCIPKNPSLALYVSM